MLIPLLLHGGEQLVEFRARETETRLKNLAHAAERGTEIPRHQSSNSATPLAERNIDGALPHMLHAGLVQILIERVSDDPAGVQSTYRSELDHQLKHAARRRTAWRNLVAAFDQFNPTAGPDYARQLFYFYRPGCQRQGRDQEPLVNIIKGGVGKRQAIQHIAGDKAIIGQVGGLAGLQIEASD